MLDALVVASGAPWKDYMVIGKLAHGPNEWRTVGYSSEPITEEQATKYLDERDHAGWREFVRLRVVLVSQEWRIPDDHLERRPSSGGVSCTNA